ncbi:hypothetical protein J6590_097777 [Homalodisca vitripennis]|nr:hypothetical protein J6590_097777 [Homalodisca vitripennis]
MWYALLVSAEDISIESYLYQHAEQSHFSRPDTYSVMDVVCSTCVRRGHFYRELLVSTRRAEPFLSARYIQCDGCESYLYQHAEQSHFSRPDTYSVMDVVCSTCVRRGHFYRKLLVSTRRAEPFLSARYIQCDGCGMLYLCPPRTFLKKVTCINTPSRAVSLGPIHTV